MGFYLFSVVLKRIANNFSFGNKIRPPVRTDGRKLRRTQGSRIQKTRPRRGFGGQASVRVVKELLREEGRGGTEVRVRAVDEVRAKIEPRIAPVEERGALKLTTTVRRVLISGAICVKLFPADESTRMEQRERSDGERPEPELRSDHELASPDDGTATVEATHLRLDGENGATEVTNDSLLKRDGTRKLPEIVLSESSLAPVLERAVTSDRGEHLLLEGLAIGRSDG